MPDCLFCHNYYASGSGLSNHLNACKIKKYSEEQEHKKEIDKLYNILENIIKKTETHSPTYVLNNCKINVNYIQNHVNNFNLQCDSFASNISEILNHPEAIQMLNSDNSEIMSNCIESVRNHIRNNGSEEAKITLTQLETDEFDVDEEYKDNITDELSNSLDKLDNQLKYTIVDKITDPVCKKKWNDYLENKKESIFYIGN